MPHVVEETEIITEVPSVASQLREEVKVLGGRITRSAIAFSEGLYKIYHNEYWRDYGYESFKSYTELELGIQYRTAMYSVNVWEALQKYNIDMDAAHSIGWSKLKLLVPHFTTKNYLDLITVAEGKTVAELKDELKRTTGKGEQPRLSVTLKDHEASKIFDALDESKNRINTESYGAALEYICGEWMFANSGETSQTSVEEIIEFVHRNYGVNLEKVEGQ